jgi:hypothetical protein
MHASPFDLCFYIFFPIPLSFCILGILEYNFIEVDADTKGHNINKQNTRNLQQMIEQ